MTMNMHLENAPTAPRTARKQSVVPAEPGWRVTCCDEGGIDEDGNPPVDQTFPVSAWLDDGDRLVPMIFDAAEGGLMAVRSPNFGRVLALIPPGRTESVADVNGRVSGGVAQSSPGEETISATDRYMRAAEYVPDEQGNAVSLAAVMHAYDVLFKITEDKENRASKSGAEGHVAVAAMLEPNDAQLVQVREWMYDTIARPADRRASAITSIIAQRPAPDEILEIDPDPLETPKMPSREAFQRALDVLRGEARKERSQQSRELLEQVYTWLAGRAGALA